MERYCIRDLKLSTLRARPARAPLAPSTFTSTAQPIAKPRLDVSRRGPKILWGGSPFEIEVRHQDLAPLEG
jgi:hypothetical protein